MSRRRGCWACCPKDCLIWEYDPVLGDIGQPIDPPWYVESGAWSVVDGTPWARDAVLQVTGPAKIWHRTPHPTSHYTGRLKVNIIVPTTAGARYRMLFNSEGLGTGGYFVDEWIPFPTGPGGDPENVRFLKVAAEISNLKDDAPLYYWAGGEPGTDINMDVVWRCEGPDDKIHLQDLTTIMGLESCQAPYAGPYVGIEIPDAVTIRIPKVEFFQAKDTYLGTDADCLGCSCARCDIDGNKDICFNMYKPLTVTYESSCQNLNGASYQLEPDPDPETFGGTCGGFTNDDDPRALPICYNAAEWSLPPIILGVTDLISGFPVWDIGCYDPPPGGDPVYPNSNSTCDPFYLEYGPYYMTVSNPEDPPEDWVCCCPGCPLHECGWFKIKITQ